MRTTVEQLEQLIQAGKIHLERMSDLALQKDYMRYRIDKVIGPALLEEMRKRGRFRIIERIDHLKRSLMVIRIMVKDTPEIRGEWWPQYHKDQKELAQLSPFDPEVDIGILGKPYFAGLADQK